MKNPLVGPMVAAVLLAGCSYAAQPGAGASFTATAMPAEVTLAAGGTASVTITLARAQAYPGAVTVSVVGLPAGVSADPLVIPTAQSDGTLILRSDGTEAPGRVSVTAMAASGPFTATAAFALTLPGRYLNRIRLLADAPIAQTNHLAAALPGGRALVMGGNTSLSVLVPDSTISQVFDPATERFSRGPELRLSAQAQLDTSIAPLANGGFLLVGTGINGTVGAFQTVATQVFDAVEQTFTRVGNAVTRDTFDRTVTPLADGGVLLTGGQGQTIAPVSSADRFDANTGQWRAAGQMVHGRKGHTATLLHDGRVLIAGGLTCCQVPNPSPDFFTGSAEIYDPASGELTETGSMAAARASHAAALLPDGRVLISGGSGSDSDPAPLSTEIYDPRTGLFTSAGNLSAARDSHSAVTLTDGRVLVIGGEVPPTLAGRVDVGVPSTELFDPVANRWGPGPALNPAFSAATVTLLGSGKVLVFGGQDVGGFPQSAAALFE
jgi:hypothetical protein